MLFVGGGVNIIIVTKDHICTATITQGGHDHQREMHITEDTMNLSIYWTVSQEVSQSLEG